MDLYNFVRKETGFDIKTNIEYTGMTDSTRPSTLSFLDNPKFADDLCNNKNIVSAFVRRKDISFLPDDVEPITAENPKAVFFELHNDYSRKYMKHEASIISESAMIHPSAFVASEGVIIGDNVFVGPNCSILPGVQIGKNTTIGPNCVLGSEGFHVFTDTYGIKRMVVHDGSVIIGKNVDLQASITVDKGLMGRDTIIADECKLDNFVHISHRVHLSKACYFASYACVGGSAEIGKNVWMGPRSVIANRITVGDGARILIGSVVINNIREKECVSGNFALPHTKHLIADARSLRSNIKDRKKDNG
jgi:UDP-3-O-[3-hydroxymyristoyl] glucosamine N-acyltransferase